MEEPNAKPSNTRSTADAEEFRREAEQLQESLPRSDWLGLGIVKHQGFWYSERYFQGTLSFLRNFQALDTDIFVATMPKCGTTWLKSLVYGVVNRHRYPDLADHPLSKSSPHELVPFVQSIYTSDNPFPDITSIPSPRLFGTHGAFETMPASFKDSNCRVVYMCRNPLDAFTSSWYFIPAFAQSTARDSDDEKTSLEATYDKFCKGVELCGPFLDNALGYWKTSQERPDKVLFLMYEDVQQRPDLFAKRIAEFLGCSFSSEEEKDGKIDEITRLCSFESLRQRDVNKTGKYTGKSHSVENRLFFRKGEVGDWVNLLAPSMAQRYVGIAKQKLEGSGLMFQFTSP